MCLEEWGGQQEAEQMVHGKQLIELFCWGHWCEEGCLTLVLFTLMLNMAKCSNISITSHLSLGACSLAKARHEDKCKTRSQRS